MPDDTRLNHDLQRMQRASETPATNEQGGLMDLPGSNQEGFASPTHKGLGGRDPKETTAYKEMMSLGKFQQLPSFIGLSPRPRKTQQELESMNVEEFRTPLEAQRKDDEILEITVKNTGNQAELLKSQIVLAKRANEKLHQQNQDDAKEIMRLLESHEAMVKIHEAERRGYLETIERLNDQVKTLTSTSDQLRQMLVPVSEKQALDSEVVSRFTSLRSSIFALVRQTWKTALKENVDRRVLSTDQGIFFISPFPISYARLRTLVSNAIRVVIFGSQSYFLEKTFQEFEQKIQAVEKELDGIMPKEHQVRVIEWRNATFKATETFRGNGNELSSITQHRIWNFLSPLQLKDAAAEQNGQKKLKAICDSAVELSFMIRQLKDDVWIDGMQFAVGQHISQWGWAVEEVESVAAGDNNQPGTIAYVITGALAKRPKENMNNTLVLEKAEVAVYE